jgi:D-serine deaminase-like pyridoxal phosphate-dependent protein
MDRTGQHNPLAVVAAAQAAGAQLRGLHFYDGHLTESDSAARSLRAHACYDYAAEITRRVQAAVAGSPGSVGEIVTSGSTTFQSALAYDWSGLPPHTVSPGTVVFHDARYDTHTHTHTHTRARARTRIHTTVTWKGLGCGQRRSSCHG